MEMGLLQIELGKIRESEMEMDYFEIVRECYPVKNHCGVEDLVMV